MTTTDTIRELREKYGQGKVIPFTMEVVQDMAHEIYMLLDAAEKAERYEEALRWARLSIRAGCLAHATKTIEEALAPEPEKEIGNE